jgi:hypothetical protein
MWLHGLLLLLLLLRLRLTFVCCLLGGSSHMSQFAQTTVPFVVARLQVTWLGLLFGVLFCFLCISAATRHLGCDGFIRAICGSAAWSVAWFSGFVCASGGWLRVVVGSVFFSSFFGVLGLLWFPRLSSGLRPPCCGLLRGLFSAPQRSCAVYLGAVHG